MDRERFSLLLLEPNEIYFEDFAVNVVELDSRGEPIESDDVPANIWTGRLKMCSKSIVYDPKDIAEPIVKIQYRDCEQIYQLPETFHRDYANVLAVRCTQYAEMLRDNKLAPYEFVLQKRLFLFNLHYDKVEKYLNQLAQLKRAASLHAVEQNDMIATIVFSRYNRLKFDPLWLSDFQECVVVDNTVEEISPLVTNPGRLLLSTKCIYFQPYNNIHPDPVKKIKLTAITALTKRRFLLRHTSLEIKWKTHADDRTEHMLYVSFRRASERNVFYERTIEQDDLRITRQAPESMALKWQNGIISNYEYLLYLNSLADRTSNDLTQYPVFPWILCDYESSDLDLLDPKVYRDLTKPIGALNAERLARLKERCEEMGDPKFLYGSHYSAPGLVLFYLVRKYPKLMLCLQNGRFDHPDRMFNSIQDAFKNCQQNMSDFKELLPEFYDTQRKGDFLRNSLKINFGARHNGAMVNHVALPPWAHDSPEKFVQTLRDALESDYVSKNLHHWIDLVFGYKQRGEEAIKADNLFYYLCYEGAVDLDEIKELTKRHAIEVQISEFGQIPKQLFDKPHVSRLVPVTADPENRQTSISIPEEVGTISAVELSYGPTTTINKLEMNGVAQTHKDLICWVHTTADDVMSTGKDGLLKCYNILDKRQYRSVAIGSMPKSSCVLVPDTNIVILGSWDNSITTYNLDFGCTMSDIPAHDDAVSCLSLVGKSGLLVSGSWDCSVKIWKGFTATEIQSYRISDALLEYAQFDDKIASVHAIMSDQHLLIAVGTFDGNVHLWKLRITQRAKISVETVSKSIVQTHSDEVTAVAFDPLGRQLASCGLDRVLLVADVVTGMNLFRKEHTEALCCMDWRLSIGEWLLLGDETGTVHVWNMQTGSVQTQTKAFDGVISAINTTQTSDERTFVIVAGVDGRDFSVKVLNCS